MALAPGKDLRIRISERWCLGVAHTPDFQIGRTLHENTAQPPGNVLVEQVSNHAYTVVGCALASPRSRRILSTKSGKR